MVNVKIHACMYMYTSVHEKYMYVYVVVAGPMGGFLGSRRSEQRGCVGFYVCCSTRMIIYNV